MNYIKKLKTSLIVLGLFLIFIPIFCYANGAIGAFFLFPPTTFLFAFFVVWATESLVIKNRLDENPMKALLAAFLINLSSTILGYLLIRFLPHGFITYFTLIIILFIGTVIAEGILLYLFYSKSGLGKVLTTAFLMNIFSYILLFGSLVIGAEPFLGTILDFVIIFYLAWRIFGLFKATKELPTGEKISVESARDLKYVVLAILITVFFIALYIDSKQEGGRPRARDAAFKAIASSLVPAGIICCDAPGADFIVPPVNGGPVCNTPPTSSTVWPADTQVDNISITTICQTDGSFKFHVEPGSANAGNCTAADCTQLGCTYTDC